jgi:hypothetical protein
VRKLYAKTVGCSEKTDMLRIGNVQRRFRFMAVQGDGDWAFTEFKIVLPQPAKRDPPHRFPPADHASNLLRRNSPAVCFGTKLPIPVVGSSVATRGKPDTVRKAGFGSV